MLFPPVEPQNENMKDQNFNDDVTKILDEAPNARKALMENYDNLLKVAQYCHDNYLEVSAANANATYICPTTVHTFTNATRTAYHSFCCNN